MAQQDVIREFLVALGFKTDEASLNKFKRGVEEVTKKVAALAVAAEAASLALGAAVQKFAANMDSLYFAGKRTGTTVKGIKAVQFAARQLGATSEEAAGALESMARFMRNTPAGEAWLKGMLGVDSRDAAGNLRGLDDVIVDVGKSLAGMPTYQANGLAGMLGIDEKMMLAIRSGDFGRFVDQFKSMTKGTDYEAAAEKARAFQEKLIALMEKIDQLIVSVGDRLLSKLMPQLERFAAWVEKNGDLLANRLGSAMEAILRLSDSLAPALGALADMFIALDKATEGWSTKLIAAGVALKALGLGGLVAGSAKLGSRAMVAGGGILARLLGGLGLAFRSGDLNEGEDAIVAKMRESWAKPGGSQPGAIQSAMAFFERLGWTRAQAAGIVSNLVNESSLNPGATNGSHYGLAQWDAQRQANFRAWSGKDIHASSFDEQLRFIQYELTQGLERMAGNVLRATTTPYAASDAVFRFYERAGDATGPRRGRDATQIAHNVSITVEGSGNPSAVGAMVIAEQDRVNQRLARNFAGAY